jgi:hypothetical protein
MSLRGTLARGDGGGLNLAMPGFAWARVSWPYGWTARLGEDRRLELFDRHGAFVAREWDEVEVGGSGDSNEFQACPDAVSVIRAFPLASDLEPRITLPFSPHALRRRFHLGISAHALR